MTLCHRAGLPFSAEHTAGFVRFQDKVYGFATADAAKRFASDPETYLNSVVEIAYQARLLHAGCSRRRC